MHSINLLHVLHLFGVQELVLQTQWITVNLYASFLECMNEYSRTVGVHEGELQKEAK
jgi:hypothetical protein